MFANDDTLRFASLALTNDPDDVDALFLREEAASRLGAYAAGRADLDRLERLATDDAMRCRVLERRIALAHATGERADERTAIAALRAAGSSLGSPYWRGVAACAEALLNVACSAYDEAADSAREALDAFASSDAPRERVRALSALIETLANTGAFGEAERLLVDATELARTTDDPVILAETHLQATSVAMSQQRFEEVVVRGKEAAERFRAIGDRVGEARALAAIAAASLRLSHWKEARDANRGAAAIFESIGDRGGLARVLMNLGMLHGRCGDLVRSRALWRAARVHQLFLGDERACTAALLNESFIALLEGDALGARDLGREGLARAEAIGHPAYRAQALANVGAAERDLGELDAAIAHMTEGLALQFELSRIASAVSDLADLALAYARAGAVATALDHAERILAIEAAAGSAAIYPAFPTWIAACIFHWFGDPRANDALETAAEIARTYARSIDDPELHGYFERLPFVVAIERALRDGTWPEA